MFIQRLRQDAKGWEQIPSDATIDESKKRIQKIRKIKDPHKAYEEFIQCGKEGIPHGYWYAGLMLYQNVIPMEKGDEYKLTENLLLAGQQGMMDSYTLLVETFLSINDTGRAINVATQMKDKGDSSGFRKIGDWFRSLGNKEKAEHYYEKAGIWEGYCYASEITTEEKRLDYIQKHDNYIRRHFEDIMDAFLMQYKI